MDFIIYSICCTPWICSCIIVVQYGCHFWEVQIPWLHKHFTWEEMISKSSGYWLHIDTKLYSWIYFKTEHVTLTIKGNILRWFYSNCLTFSISHFSLLWHTKYFVWNEKKFPHSSLSLTHKIPRIFHDLAIIPFSLKKKHPEFSLTWRKIIVPSLFLTSGNLVQLQGCCI